MLYRCFQNRRMHTFFDVDPEMYAIAAAIAPNITLANSVGDAVLDYQPVVVPGGNGVAGPTFLDNAEYRDYVFNTFQAVSVDMETSAAAHVATQFGKKFIFFRSLSDLAGAEQDGNVMGVFFSVAAANAVSTMSAFLEALPVDNNSDGLPTPNDHSPGEDTEGLLGVLSFFEPELTALKSLMNRNGNPEVLVYGGRTFYRGKIGNANVVATLTGVSISNAAMTTALMLMLFPGVERVIGGGIAGRVDPDLRIGDLVVPEQWALYQNQLYAKEVDEGVYVPVDFERNLLVGKDCGGWDGTGSYLTGDRICNYTIGETSNFDFMFPKTVQTPDPDAMDETGRISEGETRKVSRKGHLSTRRVEAGSVAHFQKYFLIFSGGSKSILKCIKCSRLRLQKSL
jgi:nucleoside phosphorylase